MKKDNAYYKKIVKNEEEGKVKTPKFKNLPFPLENLLFQLLSSHLQRIPRESEEEMVV